MGCMYMERSKIIRRVMAKLSLRITQKVIKDLVNLYNRYKSDSVDSNQLPREILSYMDAFMDEHTLEQPDKLLILKEAKRNKLFDFTLNNNLERVWRAILKEWDLSHYRLEGGL